MYPLRFTVLIATGLTVAAPALAHHSFAMFEPHKTVTLTGSVKLLQLVNPHSWLQLVTSDGREWSIEFGDLASVRRSGVTPDTLKSGDKVSVTLKPLKNGSPGGDFVSMILADGTKIGGMGPPPGSGAPPGATAKADRS